MKKAIVPFCFSVAFIAGCSLMQTHQTDDKSKNDSAVNTVDKSVEKKNLQAAPAAKPVVKKPVKPEKASQDAWRVLKKETDALIRKNFKGGFADYWHNDIDAARALLEEALTKDVYLNREKIDICREIARCHLEATRDVAAALEAVEYPFKKLQLSDADKVHAENARANLKNLVDFNRSASGASKSKDTRTEEYFQAEFKKAKAPHGINYRIVRDYIDFCNVTYGKDMLAKLGAMLDRQCELKPDNDTLNVVFNAISTAFRPTGYIATSACAKDLLEFVEKRSSKMIGPGNRAKFLYASKFPGLSKTAYGYAKKFAKEEPSAKYNEHDRKRFMNDRANAALFVAEIDAVADPGDADDICEDYLKAIGKKGDKVETAKFYEKVARRLVSKGDEKGAKKVIAYHAKVVPVREQVKCECFWWKDAPRTLAGVLESKVYEKGEKRPLNIKYGENLKFLIETDAAITGREMTFDDGSKFRFTEFFSYADGVGVRIILRMYLDNMDDIKLGLANPPGFESYIATGVENPYHCMMFDPREGGKMSTGFITQYDNITGHRTAKDTFRMDSIYLDDGVAALITVPWETVFASIPSKATPAWYVEFIHWMKGGYSLGGSPSVHNRSSFAELKFTGFDKEAEALIKRRLLFAGKRKFGASCSSRGNGYIEKWQDPELGDQEFYLKKVEPFVKSINDYASRIKKTMTDDEVIEIYAAVGEKMLNVDFVVEEMRRKWLDDKFTAE